MSVGEWMVKADEAYLRVGRYRTRISTIQEVCSSLVFAQKEESPPLELVASRLWKSGKDACRSYAVQSQNRRPKDDPSVPYTGRSEGPLLPFPACLTNNPACKSSSQSFSKNVHVERLTAHIGTVRWRGSVVPLSRGGDSRALEGCVPAWWHMQAPKVDCRLAECAFAAQGCQDFLSEDAFPE